MQKDQFSNIGLLLGRFGAVSVPGLGTFRKVTESAFFSSHRDFLYPPFQKILFDDSYDHHYDLNQLYQRSGYRQDISGGIDSININHILSIINSEGFCELSGVGKLILENNVVQFLPDVNFANGDYWGLEKVETTPVPLNHPRNKSVQAGTPSVFTSPIRKGEGISIQLRDMILPLTAIFFTLLLLSLRYMSCNSNENLHSENETNSSIKSLQVEEGDLIDNETKIIDPIGSDTASEANKVDASGLVPEKQNNNQTGECIIIVGAFSNDGNAQKMLQKVEKAGYVPFSQENNGLTRVGMTFECNESDLTDSMISMRKKFTRDAWYLKPSIAIER
ncbi:MAG: SPOR domain-containing protein [Saprospiraceae bacterium]|nr:SPOR domain-containing protein [Saprospiraceae bacterium]